MIIQIVRKAQAFLGKHGRILQGILISRRGQLAHSDNIQMNENIVIFLASNTNWCE